MSCGDIPLRIQTECGEIPNRIRVVRIYKRYPRKLKKKYKKIIKAVQDHISIISQFNRVYTEWMAMVNKNIPELFKPLRDFESHTFNMPGTGEKQV